MGAWIVLAAGLLGLIFRLHRQNRSLRRHVSSIEDLANRKATELDRATAFARAVIDNMVVGLVIVDERSVIETANPAAERTFGYSCEELAGRPLGLLVPGFADHAPETLLATNRILAIGGVLEWEAHRRNGEVFPIELALYEFPTPDGRRFAASLRDVSERREVDRLKQEFVSTVSHELRTPLTSIHGSLRLLSLGVLGSMPENATDAVRIAERNTSRLLTLINDILDWERLEAGEGLQLEPLPIDGVIRRSIEAVQAYADQESVTLERAAISGTVLGDGGRLVQVLVNLLSNAVKFSPKHSAVTVAATEYPGWVEVTVTDRGRGIPTDQRTLVFERFHQVEGSDRRGRGGTGLGLAICRALIDRHGGAIGVESTPGFGSTFWFRIPAATGTGAAAHDAEPPALAARRAG
jgi:PAS domain S-box-containing protein